MSEERIAVWRCPTCGYVTNHRIWEKAYFCSGSQSGPDPLGVDQGDHPSAQCEKLALLDSEEPSKPGEPIGSGLSECDCQGGE